MKINKEIIKFKTLVVKAMDFIYTDFFSFVTCSLAKLVPAPTKESILDTIKVPIIGKIIRQDSNIFFLIQLRQFNISN